LVPGVYLHDGAHDGVSLEVSHVFVEPSESGSVSPVAQNITSRGFAPVVLLVGLYRCPSLKAMRHPRQTAWSVAFDLALDQDEGFP